MKKKSKILTLLFISALLCQSPSPSLAKEGTNKDISNFTEARESYKKKDIGLKKEDVEKKEEKETKEPNTLKEDPYNLYTDYSAIDRMTAQSSLPRFFMAQSRDSVISAKYDLRDIGKVTSVKDQGPNGSCWAFATYGSAESVLMPNQRMDFSEKHMRNTHGFDWGPSEGGTRTVSTAYLARRSGPVLEKDDPYDIYGSNSPENLPIAKELTHALFIADRRNSTDNNLLKKMIMQNGGIYSAVMAGDEHLNKKTMAHYYQGNQPPNHAITIIGWDDNFSKSNFKRTPPGDGAFICKNSWGTNWGNQGGYYYVSYYDKNIGTQNSQYILKDLVDHEEIWQYDKLGMTSQVGLGEETYYANVFGPVKEDTYLKNVGLWTSANNAEYEIYINPNVENNGGLSQKTSIGQGKMEFAGYEKVPVESSFIPKGSKFAIIVRMKTPGYKYPVPIERPIKGFSSRVSAESGQSFVSQDGEKWTDLTDQIKNANVALKAFTMGADYVDEDNDQGIKVESISFKQKERLVKIGAEESLDLTIKPSEAKLSDLRFESSDSTVCRVDENGKIKAVGYGECVITARAKNSSKVFDTCRIKVDETNAVFKANIHPDKQNYLQGEQVKINIALTDQDKNQVVNKDLVCEILSPVNQEFKYDLKTNLTGESNFNVRLDNKAALGKYRINIHYKDKLIGINTFNVESKDFVPSPENPLFVKNDLDKKEIRPEDSIRLVSSVTNKYGDIKRYAKVNLLLISPSNEEVKKSLYTDKNGQAIFDLKGDLFKEEGRYKLKVDASLSGFDDFSETLEVLVDRNTPEMKKLNLTMDMEKDSYLVTKDKLSVNFTVKDGDKPVSDASIGISLTDPNQRTYDMQIKTDHEGKAVFSMDLTEDNPMGTYKIDATAYKEGFYDDSANKSFYLKKEGKYLNISFESSKKVYKLNESAYIKVQVKDEENKPKRNSSVDLTVTDPNQKETVMRKVTDYQGYVFIYLTPKSYTSEGEYTIKAHASAYGYPSVSSSYKIRFGENDDKYKSLSLDAKNTKDKYFTDEKPSIDIQTLDEFKNFVGKTEVNVSVKTPDDRVFIDRIMTNDKGQGTWTYKLPLTEGAYQVNLAANKSNYKEASKTLSFVAEKRPELESLKLDVNSDKVIYQEKTKTNIGLSLKDKDGNPVEKASIKASIDKDGDRKNLDLTTDEKGKASFDLNLEDEGKYRLSFEAKKDGYKDLKVEYPVFLTNKKIPTTDKKSFEKIKAQDVDAYLKENESFILDLRSKAEYGRAHIENSFNLDYHDKDFKVFKENLDKNAKVFIVSNKDQVEKIGEEFNQAGFNSIALIEEGMEEYIKLSDLDDTSYNKNLDLLIERTKDTYNVKNDLVFNLKSQDTNKNYIGHANVSYKLIDLYGSILEEGKLVTDNLGKASLKIKLPANTFPGKYKLIGQVNKDSYEDGKSLVVFNLSAKDKEETFVDFDKANNGGYFDQLKENPEDLKILKNIYGKNILASQVKFFDGKAEMLADRFDLDKYSLILFANKDQANLEDFAKMSHESYNFVRLSNLDDSSYLEKEKIKRLTSFSGLDEKDKIRNSLNLKEGAKILVLDKDGRIVNLLDEKNFANLGEILEKQGFKFVNNNVDPNQASTSNKKAELSLTCPKTKIKPRDIVEVNVQIKDKDDGSPLANRNIKYTLVDPFGRSLSYNRQTDKNGRHLFKIGTNDKTSLGKYKLKVELLDADYKNTFKYLEYEVIDSNTPDDLQMKADIKTDKSKYELGDKINLSIKVMDLNGSVLDKASASASLVDPNGKEIYNKSAQSDDKGNIGLYFATNDENILGTYKLRIRISREGFKEYKKDLEIQVGDQKPDPDPGEGSDPDPGEDTDPDPEEKPDPEKPENPIEVEEKEQKTKLSYEQALALGFFDSTDKLTMNNVKVRYGRDYNNLVLYNKENKAIKIGDIIDKKRPSIFLMGDRIDKASMTMFENSSKINDKAFNFINVVTNGSSKDLEDISKGKLYEKNFYRGNSLNGQFRSNKNQVVVLDKNGAVINVFPYKSNYELLRRFNMSNGYLANNDDYELLSLDKFKNNYPISLGQRKERGDYQAVSEEYKKFNDRYASEFDNVKLIKSDNKPYGLDQISKKDIKILLLGDYRKAETIKMWENASYIKDGDYDILNVSYLGSQNVINAEKERFKSLANVKADIYVSGGYNTLFNTSKASIVAIDKNQRFIFAKEYKSNEDIKYVLDRVANTFAAKEKVCDSYKDIEDLDILEDIPEIDPDKIYPLSFDQRLERGDLRIFEPNERDLIKKYYGKDMTMYLMKNMNDEEAYIKDLLDDRVNVILLGSPQDKRSRIMWKNSAYIDDDKVNLLKISNYKGLEDLDYMFTHYDMNDVADNFYYGGEKFDFDKEVASPYILLTDSDGKLLFIKKYTSNADIEDLANRVIKTKYSKEALEDNYPPIQEEKISADNRDHEPSYIEEPADLEENFPLTYDQRLTRGDYQGLNDEEIDFNKRFYGRDLANIGLLRNDNTFARIKDEKDENLTLLLLGSYQNESTLAMWRDLSLYESEDFSIKLVNKIGSLKQVDESLEKNEIGLEEYYTNGNSLTYLNPRVENTIIAIDKNSKLIFIKTYEDLEDLKFVLDRSVKTQYTKDIKSTKVPDIYDIDLD